MSNETLREALSYAVSLLSEVSSNFTREDDLPDALLPRIDIFCDQQDEDALSQPMPEAAQGWKLRADYEAVIDEYIEDYEMLGEAPDGRDACYTPNESDKALLKDAFMGFDFSSLFSVPTAAPAQPQAPRRLV